MRDALGALDRPVDLRRVGAEVHVVPEIAVREDVEEAPADDAREEHREPEIDDDVGALADAPRPDARRGAVAKRKPERRRTKYEGNAISKRWKSSGCTLHRPAQRFASGALASGAPAAASAAADGGGRVRRGGLVIVAGRARPGYQAVRIRNRLAGLRRRHGRRPPDGRSPALAGEHVDGHQPDADADRDVGHVERRPVVGRVLEDDVGVDEVDDVPVADAIEHVPERAAEHEREAPPERALARLKTPVERHDERDGRDRDEEEERTAHVLARRLQEPPGAAAVLREDEREVVLPHFERSRGSRPAGARPSSWSRCPRRASAIDTSARNTYDGLGRP